MERKGPDTRTLVAVMLTVAIYYVWMITLGPKPEDVPADPQGVPAAAAPAPAAPAPSATPLLEAPATDAPEQRLELTACRAMTSASSRGGALSDVRLADFKAPYTMTPVWTWLLGGGGAWKPYGDDPGPTRVLTPRAQAMAVGAGPLDAALPGMAVVSSAADAATFAGTTAAGVEVQSVLTVRPGVDGLGCALEVAVTWRNPRPDPWSGDVWVGIHDDLPELAGGLFGGYDSVAAPWAMTDGDVHTETSPAAITAPVVLEGAVDWFGVADNYFTLVALPDESSGPAGRLVMSARQGDGARLVGPQYVVPVSLAGGEAFTRRFTVYTGPKTFDALGAIDARLAELVQLGWFSFFAKPLLWLLTFFHDLSGDWGIAIILLTVTVKLLFFPLTQSGMRSAQAMQAIGPQMQAVREQYKDDPEQLNRKTMELFRENQVNPLGGCLPMLVQTPVWIGFFSALRSSVDLYQVEFLYLKDLSSVDPYAVLPFIVVVLMAVQQQLTPMGNMDPAQARMMKVMPVIFGLFFFTLPSGLVVYIFVNMLLSLGQQWLIKRQFKAPAATPAVA